MATTEQIMQELRDLGSVIKDLEAEIKPLRNRRDRLATRAMELGVRENKVAIAASISRGWTHTLKQRGGLIRRPYHDRRTTEVHIEQLREKIARLEASRALKKERGMYGDSEVDDPSIAFHERG